MHWSEYACGYSDLRELVATGKLGCVRHRVALGHGKLQAPGWAGATVGAAVCLLRPQRAKLAGRVPGRDVLAGETAPDAAREWAAEALSAAGSVRTAGTL